MTRTGRSQIPRFYFCVAIKLNNDLSVSGCLTDKVEYLHMKHLIIIGARGAGRNAFNTAVRSFGYGYDFDVKGFLDGKADALDGFSGYPPILSSVEDYCPQQDDVFVCALGEPKWRKYYADIILDKGGEFTTLIDKTVSVGRNAKIGKGCIVRDHAIISCDTSIGDFVYIQPFAVLGHDAVVGDYCHLNTYAFMGGYSKMEPMSTIHTHGTLIPHKKIGAGAIVGAGSVVMTNVKEGTTVVGIPAKRIKY